MSVLQPGQLKQLNDEFSYGSSHGETLSKLLNDAFELALRLPNHPYVINLCMDRYHFCVAFLAAIIRKQITLLPANRQLASLNEVITIYPHCYYLYDDEKSAIFREGFRVQPARNHASTAPSLIIPEKQTVCIAFTSGSTGKPQPNPKTWKTLSAATRLALTRFDMGPGNRKHLICTVPQQHMYGLETSIFYPLLGNVAVYRGKPFFPEDIRLALASASGDRILVTTPIHLKACVNANLEWPQISTIISATAPLNSELAARAEKTMNTEVREIFGCTEAGSIASRRTVTDEVWALYDDMHIFADDGQAVIRGPHLDTDIALQDRIEITSLTSFKHKGRSHDMVNIAGKRILLIELNQKLNAIPGVEDGVYLQQTDDRENTRLSALIVAPDIDESEVLRALKEMLDPVFLPRPLLKVSKLPRNETGKLPSKELLQCYRQACPV